MGTPITVEPDPSTIKVGKIEDMPEEAVAAFVKACMLSDQ